MADAMNVRLQRLRRTKGLTAKEMARLIDVAESTYREWENGRGLAKLPPFQKMSEVLAVSVTELITGEVLELSGVLEDLRKAEEALGQIRAKLATRI